MGQADAQQRRRIRAVGARGGLQLCRQHAASADYEYSVLDHGYDLIRIDARQSYQNQHLLLGLQHVDRRLPTRLSRTRR